MYVIDSQVHIWGAESPERPWIPDGASYTQRAIPLGADELIGAMNDAGVDRAVLVPPSWEGDRNDLVLEAAMKYPDRFAAMGRIPIEDEKNRELLPRWKDQPGMLGIRLTFARGKQRDWLFDGTADWFWPAAQSADIPVMLFTPGSIPRVGEIAASHRGLKLVVDHTGLPAEPRYGAVDAAVSEAIELAKYPNVAVKASALPVHVREEYPFPSLHEPIRRLVEAFGADRVFWGTDLTRLPCTYKEAVELFAVAVPGLSDDERELILGKAIANWLEWHV